MTAPPSTLPPPTRSTGWSDLAGRPLGRSRGRGPAVRMAVRELRRHPGRTAAAAVMVLVPVLLAGVASVVAPALDVSYEERVLAAMGTADAAVSAPRALPFREEGGPSPTPEQVAAVVGDDAVRLGRTSPLQVSAPGGQTEPAVGLVVPLGDPLAAGVVDVVRGRLPADLTEVAVTPGLADAAGVAVGGSLRVGEDEYSVVGVALARYGAPTDHEVVALPGTLAAPVPLQRSWWLLPSGDGPREGAVPAGLTLFTRSDVATGGTPVALTDMVSGDSVFVLSLLAALVVLQIALLAGPAFAVAARQQERVLAVLSAAGADGRALRQVVLTQALLVGVLSAVLGAAVGVGLGAVGVEAARYRVPVRIGPGGLYLGVLVGAVAVGVVAAVAAALVPAVGAARRAGTAHEPSRRLDRRLPVVRPLVGLLLITLAAVHVLRAYGGDTVGLVAAVLVAGVGMVLLTTLPVALAGRLPRGTPTALRLASREASRAGTRTAAAAGAVAGAMAALVATLCVSAAYTAAESSRYEPQARSGVGTVAGVVDAQLVAAVRQAVPGAPVGVTGGLSSVGPDPFRFADLTVVTQACPEPFAPTVAAPCSGDWRGRARGEVALLDPTAASLMAYELSADDLAHLRSGGVLVHEDTGLAAGSVELAALVTTERSTDVAGRATTDTALVTVAARPYRGRGAPALVVPEAVARDLGAWFPERVVVELVPAFDTSGPGAADPGARAAAEAAADRLRAGVESQGTTVDVEVGYADDQGLVQLLVTAAAVLVVLVATFTATALALADGRRDAAVLTSLGASPGLRRRMAAATAVVIAAVGALVGAVAGGALGLAGAWRLVDQAFSVSSTGIARRLSLLEIVPWGWIALLLVGLPVLAGAVVAVVVDARPGRGAAAVPVRTP